MITNESELESYSLRDKIYIPSQYNNSSYRYRLNDEYVSIMTNNNCYTQYSTTYCDCYNYYYKLNVVTESYQCSLNTSTNLLNYSSITSDINYSESIQNDYMHDKFILFGIIIIALLFFISLKKGYRYI